MFTDRKLVIATKHSKETVIAPVLESGCGVKCIVPDDFDTDQLGTFSGEIERQDDPLETARKKCLLAIERTNCDLAVASEGSFGPHPSIIFIPADDELLLFVDKKNNLQIWVREISTNTNFSRKEIKSIHELTDFAHSVQFPSHGLILRSSPFETVDLVKGIQDWDLLNQTFTRLITQYGTVHAETDMRAFCNPTRMNVIQQAAFKLVDKLKSTCPQCAAPGFGITDRREGLPCEWCGLPTRSTLSFISTCQQCGYTQEDHYPNGKEKEDPTYCDYCNP